jgi:hypothetical protein
MSLLLLLPPPGQGQASAGASGALLQPLAAAAPRERVLVFDGQSRAELGTYWGRDLGGEVAGLKWSTTMPGGFANCSFTVYRRADRAYSDLRMGNLVRVVRGPAVVYEGRIEDVRASIDGAQIEIEALGLGHGHSKDAYWTAPAATMSSGDLLRSVLAACMPLLNPDLSQVLSTGVAVATANLDRQYPADIIEALSALGAGDNRPWSFAVWEGWRAWFGPEDHDTVAYRVRADEVQGFVGTTTLDTIRNDVDVRYSGGPGADGGPRYVGRAVADQSVALYGRRAIVLDGGNIDARAAAALRDTYLGLHAYPLPKGEITVTSECIRDGAGAPVPLAQVRAGAVLRVEGVGDYYLIESEFDRDAGTLRLVPENRLETLDRQVARLASAAERVARGRALGSGLPARPALQDSQGFTLATGLKLSGGTANPGASDGGSLYARSGVVYYSDPAGNEQPLLALDGNGNVTLAQITWSGESAATGSGDRLYVKSTDGWLYFHDGSSEWQVARLNSSGYLSALGVAFSAQGSGSGSAPRLYFRNVGGTNHLYFWNGASEVQVI